MTIDINKVIGALHFCFNDSKGVISCDGCPYQDLKKDDCQLGNDAIALLKKQKEELDEYHKADGSIICHGLWSDEPTLDGGVISIFHPQ